jgi:hypothetical protein
VGGVIAEKIVSSVSVNLRFCSVFIVYIKRRIIYSKWV